MHACFVKVFEMIVRILTATLESIQIMLFHSSIRWMNGWTDQIPPGRKRYPHTKNKTEREKMRKANS